MTIVRKAVAAGLLAMLVGGIVAPATCVGWESSAADRLACCKRAHHVACRDQAAADDCCSDHEQSKQPPSRIAAPASVPAPMLAVFSYPVEVEPSRLTPDAVFHLDLTRQRHGPPSLSSPPLRI